MLPNEEQYSELPGQGPAVTLISKGSLLKNGEIYVASNISSGTLTAKSRSKSTL